MSEKVTLNAGDLTVALETLRASLRLADNGYLFSYSADAREVTAKRIWAVLCGVGIKPEGEELL